MVFWKDRSADHTIGINPNTMINSTAGEANAHPTTWSDVITRRVFAPPIAIAYVGIARAPFA